MKLTEEEYAEIQEKQKKWRPQYPPRPNTAPNVAHDHGTDPDVPLIRSKDYKSPSKSPSKYRNRRVTVTHPKWGSKTFPSVAESERYKYNLARLELKDPHELMHIHCQVPFMLPGGMTYYCDFCEQRLNRNPTYVEITGVLRKERVRQLKALLAANPHLELRVLKYIKGEGLHARFEPHPKWIDTRPKV